ncbi:hypothetical protein HHI36_013202, partial [Cryptolaemus montrouzieri]
MSDCETKISQVIGIHVQFHTATAVRFKPRGNKLTPRNEKLHIAAYSSRSVSIDELFAQREVELSKIKWAIIL